MLRVVKTKELASSVAAALFFAPEVFIPKLEATTNGSVLDHQLSLELEPEEEEPFSPCHSYSENKQPQGSCSWFSDLQKNSNGLLVTLRLFYFKSLIIQSTLLMEHACKIDI